MSEDYNEKTNKEYKRVAAILRKNLDKIAELHGITIVSVRANDLKKSLKVNGYILAKALKMAGFWSNNESGLWFGLAGSKHIRLKSKTKVKS